MLLLRVIPAQGEAFEHLLEGDELFVGRSSDCSLKLPDRFLSRRHARLFRAGESWHIEDLGSRNGTLVNDERISGARALVVGDQIRMSGSRLELRDADITQPAAGARAPEQTVFLSASALIDSQRSRPLGARSLAALERHSARLEILNEVHRALASSLELDDLLELILERAFEHLRPEEGLLLLRRPDGAYEQAARRAVEGIATPTVVSETLVREVADKGLAALVYDIESDERFVGSDSLVASGVRSLVAAPLLDEHGSLGMIALSSRLHRRQFEQDDLELLVSLAAVAALRIRNLALAEEAAERRRLEEELRMARRIQMALLPAQLPPVAGWQLLGRNMPSRQVSGDIYEVVARGERELVLWVADVSGKGIAASLLTASLEALLADPIALGRSPAEICGPVAQRLFERTPAAQYATAFLAVVEPRTGRLAYTNAGHNPALLLRLSGEVEELGATGLPLGLMPQCVYREEGLAVAPGETLILYTDGFTEATDPEGGEFGTQRLREVCAALSDAPPADLVTAVEDALDNFTRGEPYADDRTLLIARRIAT